MQAITCIEALERCGNFPHPQAKWRLADEYDAAQERGEVASAHDGKFGRSEPERLKPTAADIGLSRKDIHEARIIRDAFIVHSKATR
ncbi:MAG: hypothetical protein ACTHN2_19825 [Nitrobacter sp.]